MAAIMERVNYQHYLGLRMKKSLFALLLISQGAGAVTLEQAFQKAISNEQIQIVQEQITQAQERINQVEGGLYPDINLSGTITRQEDDPIFERGFGQQTQKNLQVQLVQPLFQGFREFAALRLAKSDSKRNELLMEQAKLNLYQSLADIFYNIKSAENEIALSKELSRLSQERVTFLQQRVKVGRSRRSELISAQAQLASVNASLSELNSGLRQQREAFSLVTTMPANSKLDGDMAVIDLKELDALIAKIDKSPWIEVREREVEIADETVNMAKAGHWPSIDLRANYYLERGGSLQGVNWDVGLALTMPIFSGGSDQATIREALAQKRESILRQSYEKRRLESDIRATFASLQESVRQLKGLEESVTLNRRNYEELNREYGLGLVTNLDVINALNQYVQSRRDLNRIEVSSQKDRVKLKTLTGEIL